jgi:hypothetical protein
MLLWLPTCFSHSCGNFQGDLFDNKHKIVIKMCVYHSTVLKLESRLKNTSVTSHQTTHNWHIPSIPYITHTNLDLWKLLWPYYILQKKKQINEHLEKLLHSILSPTHHYHGTNNTPRISPTYSKHISQVHNSLPTTKPLLVHFSSECYTIQATHHSMVW